MESGVTNHSRTLVGPDGNATTSLSEVEQLSKLLSTWKEVLIFTHNVLMWRESHYPYCIAGVVSFTFLVWWWLNASFLTTVAMVLLFLVLVDHFLYTFGSRLFNGKKWTGEHERQFEELCHLVLDSRKIAYSVYNHITDLKSKWPQLFVVVTCGILFLVGLVGYFINNALLLYLFGE
ncbi:ARL6IP1 [Bugula neritina]|uniref:ARL6IP1 n=1 Tax=Bugula neritina TaxID=10212 RepID=A0A7J7JW71_BUGNE|nr:ARL6IP1 [Bugula neritina]